MKRWLARKAKTMATLVIQLDAEKSNDSLMGFPFQRGQYIESEVENDGIIHVYVVSEFDDTTTAQEQFLNTNNAVVKYEVH